MGTCFLYGNGGGAALNFSVKPYATEAALLADTPGENTIGIITETPIPGFTFAARNPYIGYKDVDLLSGVTLGDGYISSSGGITGQTASNPELYTVDYIPVEYGKSYEYRYTVSASKNMWLAIAEYTGAYTFSTRLIPVNSEAGTYHVGIYTPSSENVTAVRLTWRTFPSTTYTMEFIEKDVPYQIDGTDDGTVWIHTGTSSVVEFNALKKNAVKVYPVAAQQYVSGAWVSVTAKSYQDGAWKDWFIAVVQAGVIGTIGFNTNAYNPVYPATAAPGSGYIQYTSNNGYVSAIVADRKIDLTNYTEIKATLDVITAVTSSNLTSKLRGASIVVMNTTSNSSASVLSDAIVASAQTTTAGDGQTLALDVSGLTGEYYVGVVIGAYSSSNGSIRLYDLEVT